MFKGSIVALATPFGSDDTVDDRSLARLIEFHVGNGTDALVIAGTTGESATLSKVEHVSLIASAVEISAGRMPVIAGTGSNSTRQTIELSKACEAVGANGFLLVAPYYNKPTQEGMYRHFSAVAEVVTKPIIIYNVPGRTCSDIKPATVGRLATHERIVGIKDATGDLHRLAENLAETPEDFVHLSGDDFSALDFLIGGGSGVISVTANVAPAMVVSLCRYAANGSVAEARALNVKMQPLNTAMFVEPNPIPVKWALNRMGLAPAELRLPLTPLSSHLVAQVEGALLEANLVD